MNHSANMEQMNNFLRQIQHRKDCLHSCGLEGHLPAVEASVCQDTDGDPPDSLPAGFKAKTGEPD